tara:strand:+ start:53 stop:544 length:492 start_codon:yes stop_codon:yes gene_type:complete
MVKVACYINKDGNLAVLMPAYNDTTRPAGYTDDELLERLIARKQADGGIPDGAPYRIIDNSEVPSDRTFRNAWEDTGSAVQVNLPKARVLHMNVIRAARNAELSAKDITFMRAVEAGDASAQAAVATEKQVLRDIPATFDITTDVDTPEKLKAKWPSELPARA